MLKCISISHSDLPLHGPRYATGIARPDRQAARRISHTLRYVRPSTPHTWWRLPVELVATDSSFWLEPRDAAAGGHFHVQLAQCGLRYWSCRQYMPGGQITFWQVAVNTLFLCIIWKLLNMIYFKCIKTYADRLLDRRRPTGSIPGDTLASSADTRSCR